MTLIFPRLVKCVRCLGMVFTIDAKRLAHGHICKRDTKGCIERSKTFKGRRVS